MIYLLENLSVPDTAQIYPTSIVFIESEKCHHEVGVSFTFLLQVGKLRHKKTKQLVQVHTGNLEDAGM